MTPRECCNFRLAQHEFQMLASDKIIKLGWRLSPVSRVIVIIIAVRTEKFMLILKRHLHIKIVFHRRPQALLRNGA